MPPTSISQGTRLCSSRHVSKTWLLGCAPQMPVCQQGRCGEEYNGKIMCPRGMQLGWAQWQLQEAPGLVPQTVAAADREGTTCGLTHQEQDPQQQQAQRHSLSLHFGSPRTHQPINPQESTVLGSETCVHYVLGYLITVLSVCCLRGALGNEIRLLGSHPKMWTWREFQIWRWNSREVEEWKRTRNIHRQ